MKRSKSIGVVVVLLCAAAVWAAGKAMQVQVRQSELREKPSALGAVVGTVKYGQEVEILEESGESWKRVKATGSEGGAITGWIRTSALTQQKIKIKAGGGDAKLTASGEEIALAGKGLDEVSRADLKKNPKLKDGYATVDRMVSDPLYRVSGPEVVTFLEAGGVAPRESGK